MGQYYVVVNKTKKEYLNPHVFGDGVKAWEIVANHSTVQALGILLIRSDEGGGGDLQEQREDNPQIVGRWADDQLVIIGDYDSSDLYAEVHGDRRTEESDENGPIWEKYDSGYIDISYHVLDMMYKERIVERKFIEEELKFRKEHGYQTEATALNQILTGVSLPPLPPKESRMPKQEPKKEPKPEIEPEEKKEQWYVESLPKGENQA